MKCFKSSDPALGILDSSPAHRQKNGGRGRSLFVWSDRCISGGLRLLLILVLVASLAPAHLAKSAPVAQLGANTLTGSVVDDLGRPLAGIVVQARIGSQMFIPLVTSRLPLTPQRSSLPYLLGREKGGESTQDTPIYSAISNSDGIFTISNVPDGAYIITPLQDGRTFDPASRIVSLPSQSGYPTFSRNAQPYSEMILVPAGSFQMGCSESPQDCENDETPLHSVYLDDFLIDKYEVTNSRYADCVKNGPCNAPEKNASKTRDDYYDNPAYANFPVVEVNWHQARIFCEWQGKRLPTEAEWEKAARGGSEPRIFPWGNAQPDCSLVNFDNKEQSQLCVGDTSAVDSYQAGTSPYGMMEMAGNVWEWVNDWYRADYYQQSSQSNPTGPDEGKYRVIRGGAWDAYSDEVRTAYRMMSDPLATLNIIGFRCALTP
jgi:formylglycine-generating enzyme required for sulfatase activity